MEVPTKSVQRRSKMSTNVGKTIGLTGLGQAQEFSNQLSLAYSPMLKSYSTDHLEVLE